MDKLLAVARREFIATVRTKAFLLSVVLMPGLIMLGIFGFERVQQIGQAEKLPTRRIAVVDGTGMVFPYLVAQVEAYNIERPNQRLEFVPLPPDRADEAHLRSQVRNADLYGFLILAPDAVDGNGGCVLARRDSQLETGQRLLRMLNDAVVAARFRRAGFEAAQIEALRRQVPVRAVDVATGAPVSISESARLVTPFAFMFLLFMGTFGISQGLLTTVIEEKSSRVMEVLLSAVSPLQLMAGKILGMVLVGFVLLTVWGGVGLAGARVYRASEMITAYRLAIALLYFVPGFLLISSLLAAIGAACNELKEAQSMVFPLSLITIVPMLFWFYIAENPASALSVGLSYLPPITPFVMVLRVCADPDTPVWQVVTTLVVLWGAVAATMWAASKVFRVGVLMYGKPPSLRELLRWVRRA